MARNRHAGTAMWTAIASRTHISRSSFTFFKQNACPGSISRSPVAAMMQTAESGHQDDFVHKLELLAATRPAGFLYQPEMSSAVVVRVLVSLREHEECPSMTFEALFSLFRQAD